MTARPETVTQNSTAAYIRGLAAQHHVAYVQTHSDRLAQHMTRLADDAIQPDEIECMLLALQRAGHLSRRELIHLQVEYLREAKP
jgi:phosphoribosylanthranilate isomerase